MGFSASPVRVMLSDAFLLAAAVETGAALRAETVALSMAEAGMG